MSDRDQNNNNPSKGRFSGSKKRRVLDSRLAEKLEKQDEEQTIEKIVRESIETGEDKNDNPKLDKAALREEYKGKLSTLAGLLSGQAERRTTLSALAAERSAILTGYENEKAKLETDLKRVAAEQIGGFLKELKDVQDALGTIVSEIESLEGSEKMQGFITGLALTGEGLGKVFNQYAEKPDNEAPLVKEPVKGQVFEAETPDGLDFDGKDKDIDAVALSVKIARLDSRIEETQNINSELDEKITKGEEMLTRARENVDSDLRRAREQHEHKKTLVIEKLAKAVLPVADNLARAASTLENQKEGLGSLFNSVSSRVAKAGDELQDAFQKFGIERLDALGQKFDPSKHMAVTMAPSNGNIPPDHVLHVAEEGYTLNGKLIRDAKVIVAQ